MDLRETKQKLLSLAENMEALAAEVESAPVSTKTASEVDFSFGSVSSRSAYGSGASAETQFLSQLGL